MQTNYTFFQSELEKLIKSEIDHLKDQLVTGHSTFEFPTYKYNVGKINGLQSALELIDEAWSIVNGGEQRGR
jgi:hypothetical protein